jgi:hypothetical protein
MERGLALPAMFVTLEQPVRLGLSRTEEARVFRLEAW